MIQISTKAAMRHLIASGTEHGKYTPTGMFLTYESGVWVACDNSTGDAWMEEFATLEEAVDWLNGKDSDGELEESEDERIPEVQKPKKQEPPEPKDPLDRPVTLRDVVRLVQWFRLELNPCTLDSKSKQFEAWMKGETNV